MQVGGRTSLKLGLFLPSHTVLGKHIATSHVLRMELKVGGPFHRRVGISYEGLVNWISGGPHWLALGLPSA